MMIFSEIAGIVFQFIKTYWKQILIAGIIIVLAIYIWILRANNSNHEDDKKELQKELAVMEEVVKSRDEIIQIQNTSMKIFEDLTSQEKTSETKYKETITNNKEVIKEYVNSERSKEDLEKLYQYENKQWQSIKESVNRNNPVVKYNLNWWSEK
jgi:septum formation inhibitor MinC